MRPEKALNNLKQSIYGPVIFAIFMMLLAFGAEINKSFPDLNKLFSIMSPLSLVSGMLIMFGANTIHHFNVYMNALESEIESDI